MIPDYKFYMDINNNYTDIKFKNELYTGNYHIIISGDILNSYYIISKFNILDDNAMIYKLNSNNNNIQIIWNMNETPKIRTINNSDNTSYFIELKIYEL